MEQFVTLCVDASAGAVQTVAGELFGRGVGVTQGRYTEVTLPAGEADRLAAELRKRGYEVTE